MLMGDGWKEIKKPTYFRITTESCYGEWMTKSRKLCYSKWGSQVNFAIVSELLL